MSTGHVVVSREWRNRLRGRSETEQRNFIPTSQTVASYAAGAIIENALNEIGNKFRLFSFINFYRCAKNRTLK